MKQELDPPRAMIEQDIEPFERTAAAIDQAFHGMVARVTNVLSPMVFEAAFRDWGVHLALSPGKQMQLIAEGVHKWARFATIAADSAIGRPTQMVEPRPGDKRFSEAGVVPAGLI